MKILNIYNKGFTLIETLVAVSILMISVAGPLTIAQKSLYAAMSAKDQVTASFLAQDMMEQIKNDRSSDGFDTWENRNYDCTNCVLNIQTSDGLYGTGGGTQTKFTRVVDIDTINDTERKVTVTVSWKSGTIQNSFALVNYMYDISL